MVIGPPAGWLHVQRWLSWSMTGEEREKPATPHGLDEMRPMPYSPSIQNLKRPGSALIAPGPAQTY